MTTVAEYAEQYAEAYAAAFAVVQKKTSPHDVRNAHYAALEAVRLAYHAIEDLNRP